MSIGEKIRELRDKQHMTQEELAKAAKVTKQTIFKYENGIVTNIPMDKLQIIANKLGCSPEYLLGWSTSINRAPLAKNVEAVPLTIQFAELGAVHAGYDGTLNGEPTGRMINVPLSELHGRDKDEFFAIQVKGDSMYPIFMDKDSLLCERCESVDSGEYAIVLYNGDEATVKKVNYVYGENWLELIPVNPMYKPMRIEGADLQSCRIVGKVISMIRNFR